MSLCVGIAQAKDRMNARNWETVKGDLLALVS
jgi:hypothetical protein